MPSRMELPNRTTGEKIKMTNTSGFLQVEPSPAKQWAKGFDTLKVI